MQIPKVQKIQPSHHSFGIFACAAHKMLVKLAKGVNFINVFHAHFLYKILAPSYVSAWRQKLVRKICTKNVGEIDNRSRFEDGLNLS